MGLSASQFWLTDLKYLEGKRAIVLQFGKVNAKRMVSLPFFPSFFVSRKVVGFEALGQMLSRERKRFKIEQKAGAFKVSAGSFSDLNELANALFRETGCRPLVLLPERQFLLERNWSYFDCFAFFSEKEFVKLQQFSVPEARLCFFSEPLDLTLRQLAECDLKLAEKTLESIVASNILRLPLQSLPSSRAKQLEAALLNLFWEKGFGKEEKQDMVAIRQARERLDKGKRFAKLLLLNQVPVLAACQNAGKAVTF